MANSGISQIDQLLAGAGPDIDATNASAEATGALQELLHGHGYRTPLMRGPGYGTYNDTLKSRIKMLRRKYALGDVDSVNQATLKRLLSVQPSRPVVSRAYMTLVLDVPYTGYAKIVSLVAVLEGAGQFAALSSGHDHAGLSIGIIQWAQKPKRLAELVRKFDQQAKEFVRPLLGLDTATDTGFNALIAYLESADGGVDGDGEPTDPKFNLVKDPWRSKFRNVCMNQRLQKIQVLAAIDAFTHSHSIFPASLSPLTSERSVALYAVNPLSWIN